MIADVYADVCLCPRSCLVCLWFALFVSLCLACLCACICSSPYPKFRKVLGICRGFLNPLNSRHVASRNIYKGYPRNCLSNSSKFTLRSLRISKRKIPNTVPYFCSLRTSEHPPVPSISTFPPCRTAASAPATPVVPRRRPRAARGHPRGRCRRRPAWSRCRTSTPGSYQRRHRWRPYRSQLWRRWNRRIL